MRYKVTASVEGNLYLDRNFSFKKNEFVIEFSINKENKLSKIAIWIDVVGTDIDKYRSDISKKDGIIHLTVGGDAEVKNKILNQFQLLESNLSFISHGMLRKIHWESAEEEFVPQNDEEQKCVKVFSLKTTKEYPEPKRIIKEAVLEHYVMDGEKYDELAIAKAFWREGLNYYKNFQYVQAFYNYYFIIEGFYANRKTGEKEVFKEFGRSKEFSEIADKTMKAFLNETRHGRRLLEMMEEEHCAVDKDGLQALLFKIRGRVHHYSDKSRKALGTPFNQKEFETIAFICGYVACLAIGCREVKINNPQK